MESSIRVIGTLHSQGPIAAATDSGSRHRLSVAGKSSVESSRWPLSRYECPWHRSSSTDPL